MPAGSHRASTTTPVSTTASHAAVPTQTSAVTSAHGIVSTGALAFKLPVGATAVTSSPTSSGQSSTSFDDGHANVQVSAEAAPGGQSLQELVAAYGTSAHPIKVGSYEAYRITTKGGDLIAIDENGEVAWVQATGATNDANLAKTIAGSVRLPKPAKEIRTK